MTTMLEMTATELKAREATFLEKYNPTWFNDEATEKAMDRLVKLMEEMANTPATEFMGKRQPGERQAREPAKAGKGDRWLKI